MSVYEWVSVICTLLSMAGAGFAWWSANKSKSAREKARAEAEQAKADAARADESLRAAREAVAQLKALVEAATPPPLAVLPLKGNWFRLKNQSGAPITITGLANGDELPGLDFFECPRTLEGGESVRFRVVSRLSHGLPGSTLALYVQGRDRVFHVDIPA